MARGLLRLSNKVLMLQSISCSYGNGSLACRYCQVYASLCSLLNSKFVTEWTKFQMTDRVRILRHGKEPQSSNETRRIEQILVYGLFEDEIRVAITSGWPL
jgi:hypothetical protein